MSLRAVTLGVALAALVAFRGPVSGQTPVRDVIAGLEAEPIRFDPPSPVLEEIRGVPVYVLPDRDLPLVTLYATFKGGYSRLPRTYYGAANALPALLRTSGAGDLPPDSVDARIEYLALSMSFGQGGGSLSAMVNTLTDNLGETVDLWGRMLRTPAFDSAQVEIWRGAEVERVSRRRDNPAAMAYSRFNLIMFGDHPVGWELSPEDLDPDDLSREKLEFVHGAIVCPDNMVMGIVGDVDTDTAREIAEGVIDGLPPCSGALLDEEPEPELRTEPGVFVIHRELEQSVVVMAHVSSLRQGDTREYFASRIGQSILGGSGLSSRLSQRLRTREGLAYGASSLWTTSATRDGLIGAITRTRPETAVEAARLMLEEMDSVTRVAPAPDEVGRAVDEIVNGYVFNFETPFQIVARQIAFRNLRLPDNWLERYLEGIQQVTPGDVREAFATELEPSRMTILLVGDTTRFEAPAGELGTVTVLPDQPSSPRGSPQSRR